MSRKNRDELFAKMFEKSAERNIAGSKRAQAASGHLRKFAAGPFGHALKAEMGDGDVDPVTAIADLLDELAAEQADRAEFDLECCKECMKAAGGELEKHGAPRSAVPFENVDEEFRKLVAMDDREDWRQ